jgi:RNA polymerase sigma factor (sigma-70 family)
MNELDPPRSPDELLTHAAWMRRFATALAGADGEDLAQDAWVRVLTRPLPALERPRAWLASALRNAARSRARGAARRAQREAAHAGEPAEPSGAELVARAELEQLAVRTVLALDEPYRETLLMRYLRGLEPAEIAQRQSVPASTVRNRIARGLELVRAKLDANHGGRREAWLALIVPFERGFAPATTLAGGTAAGVAAGGALLATKWIVGGVAAALIAVLWWNRGPSERERALEEAPAVVSTAASLATEEPPVTASDEPKPAASARTPLATGGASSQSLLASASLDVHVTFARDGSPAADCEVEVLSWDAPSHPRVRTGRTGADGRVSFTGLEPGQQVVEERRADGEWVEVAAGETLALELVIPLGIDVDLRVVEAEGTPVAQAEVWLSDYANGSEGGVVGRTGAGGRFLVRDVGPSRSLAAFADGHAPSAQRDVIGNPGDHVELTLELRGPGAALAGVVYGPEAEPVAGAEVLLGWEGTQSLTMPNGEVLRTPPPVRVVCDEQGRFEARGLAPGDLHVQVRAPGLAPLLEQVMLSASEPTRKDLTLGLANRVHGVVRNGAGEPLADITVSAGRYMDFDYVRTRSAADGSYLLDGLRSGASQLQASSDELGKDKTRRQMTGQGETAEWNPVLVAGPTMAGTVVDEHDAPLTGWHVAAVERGRLGLWLRSGETDAAGRFRLANCPTTDFVIAVRSPADIWGAPVVLVEDFQPGQTDIVVRVPDNAHPTAYVSGRVRASDGRALAQAQVTYVATATGSGFGVFPDTEGRFRIGPLRPGAYELELTAQGLGTLHRRGLELAPGQELELGWLTLDPAGQIVVQAFAPAGTPLPERVYVQLLLDGAHEGSIEIQGLEGRSQPLGPGRYTLRTRGWSWYAPETEVELAPGETRTLELPFQPATNRLLRFVPPAGDGATSLQLVVRDESGATVCDFGGFQQSLGPMNVQDGAFGIGVGGLLPGRHTFEARTDTGRTANGSFDVLDLSPSSEALEFPLR